MTKRITAALLLISILISSILYCGCSSSRPAPVIDVSGPVFMGNYGGQDIEWIVLDVQDGKALLLSKYVIDARAFNNANKKTSWKKCSLRSWLNGSFYNYAFSSAEKNIIQKTELADQDKVTDKIFLLSELEVHHLIAYEGEALLAYPTRYAKDQGVELEIDNTAEWLIRDMGYRDDYCLAIGELRSRDVNVSWDYCGIRPAMWVSIEN